MRLVNLFFILFLFFFSCSKFEWVNPYDPLSDKSLFTPSGPGAVMDGNAVKLTWTQSNDKISGFALYRSVEGEPITSLAQVQKTTTQYVDASVTAGKRYTYYIVAVAGSNNSDTVKYSIVPVFPVSVSTVAVSDVSLDSAKVSGNLTSAGGGSVISRGICWSTSTGPTVSNSKTIEGTSVGEFSSVLKGLQSGAKYYVRAYGENSRGVSYGSELSFTTFGIPQLYTYDADSIGSTYARIGGNITSDGGSAVTERGVCWSTSENPTVLNSKTIDGSGTGNYISRMKELSPSTRYYVRAYATNKFGTAYGSVVSFTTTQPAVLITTSEIINITSNSASGGGSITSDGGSVITARGVCWSTSQNPTIANAKTEDIMVAGTFKSNITGLSPSTTYFVRAYATNQYGTTYGQQQTFKTVSGPLYTNGSGVTDIDGNIYKTVIIGNQEWMAENLKVTTYTDGVKIPKVMDGTEWLNQSSGAYCEYGNDPAVAAVYGKLYNYYVTIGSQKVCPTGWHVPSLDEFTILENYLGKDSAGYFMKTTVGWYDGLNANNLSGFSGLPAGSRESAYVSLYTGGFWWTSTEYTSASALMLALSRVNNNITKFIQNKTFGYSIRCLKN